jgi:hypothetical protein
MSKTPGPTPKAPPPAAAKEPAPPPETTTLVRFTKLGLLDDGDIAPVGAVLRLGTTEAEKHVRAGRAVHDCVRMKAAKDHVLINGVVHATGDLVELSELEAIAAYGRGAAVLLHPGSISRGRLKEPERIPPIIKPFDPFAEMPRVRIRALRPTVVPGGGLDAGQESEVPESWACVAISTGAVERCNPLARWTDRAEKYLKDLLDPVKFRYAEY